MVIYGFLETKPANPVEVGQDDIWIGGDYIMSFMLFVFI